MLAAGGGGDNGEEGRINLNAVPEGTYNLMR